MKGSRPLTRQQVKGLLALTDTIREQTFLTLGFCTDYRISALLSLKVADVSTNGIMGVM
jgi:site-specific recombinase XerD